MQQKRLRHCDRLGKRAVVCAQKGSIHAVLGRCDGGGGNRGNAAGGAGECRVRAFEGSTARDDKRSKNRAGMFCSSWSVRSRDAIARSAVRVDVEAPSDAEEMSCASYIYSQKHAPCLCPEQLLSARMVRDLTKTSARAGKSGRKPLLGTQRNHQAHNHEAIMRSPTGDGRSQHVRRLPLPLSSCALEQDVTLA